MPHDTNIRKSAAHEPNCLNGLNHNLALDSTIYGDEHVQRQIWYQSVHNLNAQSPLMFLAYLLRMDYFFPKPCFNNAIFFKEDVIKIKYFFVHLKT